MPSEILGSASGSGLCRVKPSAVTPVTQPVRHARPVLPSKGEIVPLPWIWLMVSGSHAAGVQSPGITSACERGQICGLSYAAPRPITVAGQPSVQPGCRDARLLFQEDGGIAHAKPAIAQAGDRAGHRHQPALGGLRRSCLARLPAAVAAFPRPGVRPAQVRRAAIRSSRGTPRFYPSRRRRRPPPTPARSPCCGRCKCR